MENIREVNKAPPVFMKLAYITTQLPAPSETFACHDVRTLHEQGLDISVYPMRPRHANHATMVKERRLSDVPIAASGMMANLLGLLKMFARPLLALHLFRWVVRHDGKHGTSFIKLLFLTPISFYILGSLERMKPDVVHLFWGHYPSLVGFLVRTAMPSVKLTMFLGAYDLEMALGVSRSMANQCDAIFTHARVNLQQLNTLGVPVNKTEVIYRGIDTAYLSSQMTGSTKEWSGVYLAAGRLLPSKGFDKSIHIASHAEKATLLIAGEGPDLDRLKNTASHFGIDEWVHFMGFLNQSQLIKEMEKASYFLMLSNKPGERLPNVVKEAMFAGCVCFVSMTPGIDELIVNGKTGFILTSDDPIEVLEIIDSLSLDDHHRIGKQAISEISTRFNVIESMNQYVASWKRLMA